MKKTISKPENWQDFETLCKKLWGEIWKIPTKIKKNGRSGQSQSGVDIYGIPEGKSGYWGIQCKGKDEYSNAKLTKSEIEKEINKANSFQPPLDVFIFATTMNKDSEIEEYIRIKDLENKEKGKFEVLIYCWEDIADLIEDNQDTFNYYVRDKQHKNKYGFSVYLNDFQSEYIIHPKCIKKIRRYKLIEPKQHSIDSNEQSTDSNKYITINFPAGSLNEMISGKKRLNAMNRMYNRINYAICPFEIIMENTGSMVIEDWRLNFNFVGEHEELIDYIYKCPSGIPSQAEISSRRTYVEGDTIYYRPKDNAPLIQKDNRYFESYIIPKCKEYTIPIEWELLARDFNTSGQLFIKVQPIYEYEIVFKEVHSENDLKDDEIISIKTKKNYTEEEGDYVY